MTNNQNQWRKPWNAGKFHIYDENGVSLCGQLGFFLMAPADDGADGSPDNCRTCARAAAARARRQAEQEVAAKV